MNIDTDLKFEDITFIRHLENLQSPLLPKIKEVYDHVKDILNTRVTHVFPNFTLHDTGHSFRIMEYMCKLVNDYAKLSELEITLLIYSALLHDIGMAVSSEDIDLIKSDTFPFCETKFSAMKKLKGDDEALALQEYIRRIHSSLSSRYIKENLKDKLVIPKLPSLDFTTELADICESHTKDYAWIKANLRTNEIRGEYTFNAQFIATILRLADILDIDSNRTPYNLYRLISPKGESDKEWKQHYIISNTEKIVLDDKTQQKKLVFHGKSTNASIHRKLLDYIEWVRIELTSATHIVSGMPAQYTLVYDTNPEINIQTEGYSFSDYKMTLEFRAISTLLMGEKIYGNKNLGLRELIQNSIDSCRLRQEVENSKLEFGEDIYHPKIKVILDKDKNQVIVKDNGTGMSIDIIKKHFLNIGVSYYKSDDFLLKDLEYKPIGNFGIGFLACFMLSDEVNVITRYYKSKHKYLIELEKADEWTSLTEIEDVNFDGTEVILKYDKFIEVFNNKTTEVEVFLKKYFLTDEIIFELIDRAIPINYSISNPIRILEVNHKGLIKIELQKYLKDIEGYVLIRRKSNFIKTLEEIDFEGAVYVWDNEQGIKEVNDFNTIQIDDYIDGNEIKYFSIPLVESHNEEEFLSGMKFTNDDIDEVIDKMDRNLSWISVLVDKNYQSYLYDERISTTNSALNNLGLDDLTELGHSDNCDTKAFVKTVTLFEGRKNELYLPYDNKDREPLYLWRTNENRKELFIRNVFIKDFRFTIPLSASIFEIKTIVTNINSRKFIPDISRNNVDQKARDTINYLIGKAIHLGACKELGLEIDERATLQTFISTFYNESTEFEV